MNDWGDSFVRSAVLQMNGSIDRRLIDDPIYLMTKLLILMSIDGSIDGRSMDDS